MVAPPVDKRRHTRLPSDLRYFFFIDGKKYAGKVSNISLSGAFLSEADPEISPEHNSHSGILKIYLEDELLLLKCQVVYAATRDNEYFLPGAGVAFDDGDHETNKSITRIAVAYHLC